MYIVLTKDVLDIKMFKNKKSAKFLDNQFLNLADFYVEFCITLL